MKRLTIGALALISVWSVSCQQNKESSSEKDTPISQQLTRKAEAGHSAADTSSPLPNLSTPDSLKTAIREGLHSLSLQWISWEDLGQARIDYLGENRYHIEGEQRNPKNNDYLKLEGTLEPLSETELIFDGTVEHQIAHLYQGKPCVKKGKQIFKATKNRRYWRMQDMENCEGGGVIDYVDIYF